MSCPGSTPSPIVSSKPTAAADSSSKSRRIDHATNPRPGSGSWVAANPDVPRPPRRPEKIPRCEDGDNPIPRPEFSGEASRGLYQKWYRSVVPSPSGLPSVAPRCTVVELGLPFFSPSCTVVHSSFRICKTVIRGFESHPRLGNHSGLVSATPRLGCNFRGDYTQASTNP